MLKKMTSLATAGLCFLALSTNAFAQGEDTDWGTEDTTTEPDPVSTSDNSGAAAASGDAAGSFDYQMAISLPLFDSGLGSLIGAISGSQATGTADILYGLDANTFLDLNIGINFGPGAQIDDPNNPGNTIQGDDAFGLTVGAGYRMYKETKGRIHPYMQPGALIAIGDFANLGPTLVLAGNVKMGVDLEVVDQLTIGTAVGAQLSFSNEFETIEFGLFTEAINATFWW